MPNDAPVPDDEPKNFYDLDRAAETAARWPLLQAAWLALGGTTRSMPRPQSAVEQPQIPRVGNGEHHAGPPTSNGTHSAPAPVLPAQPEPAPRKGEAKPAQTLEELFGRMR